MLYVSDDTCDFQVVPSCVEDYSREAFSRRMVSGSSTASGLYCFVRIADLIPSRYGVFLKSTTILLANRQTVDHQ
jgi:hypothetical protein